MATPAIDKPALLAKYGQERDKRLRPEGKAPYEQVSGRLAHCDRRGLVRV